VTAGDGQVRLQAADSHAIVSIVDAVDADVGTAGQMLTHGGRWSQLARALPPGPVAVEYNTRNTGGQYTMITAGRTKVKLLSQRPDDYPEQPLALDSDLTAVDGAVLGQLLDRIAITVSTDESRVNLNGALLLSTGSEVTMVSTDGHRLTKSTVEMAGPKLQQPVIIPRRGVEAVRRLLAGWAGSCSWGVARGHLFARVGSRTIAVRLTVGVAFPPWTEVVPKSHHGLVQVDREALMLTLKQAVVFAPNPTMSTKFEILADEIRVYVDNPELGAAQLSVDAKLTGSPITIGLNAGYVLEALEAVTSEGVSISVMGELDPIVVRPAGDGDTLVVLMPMRI
jgi:DNA polymerase-3 subunit beta